MEGTYKRSVTRQTEERSLYSPVYDDMLERRASKSYVSCRTETENNSSLQSHGKSGRTSVFSRRTGYHYRTRLIQLLAAAVILTFLFGAIGVHADPKDVTCSEDEFIYRVITVEYGDTLWDIARTWSGSTDDDIRAYIDNIREINHIHGDNLKEGQLLLIYYGESMSENAVEMAGN